MKNTDNKKVKITDLEKLKAQLDSKQIKKAKKILGPLKKESIKYKIDFKALEKRFFDFDLFKELSRRKANRKKTNSKITIDSMKKAFYSFDFIQGFKEHGINRLRYVAVALVTVLALSAIISVTYYNEQKKYIITNNQGEVYFYSRQYTKAIKEYVKIASKDKDPSIWDVKISEIYSVMGDIKNSNKYINLAKATKNKDGYLLNYIVFTEYMNKDYAAAIKDGSAYLKLDKNNKSLIKTMFTVYMANNQLDYAKSIITTYPVNKKSAYDIAEYARMLMIVEDWDNGFKELKTAWEMNKDEFKVYDVLSQIATYNRDLLLQKVSDLSTANPNENSYKMWLAKIYSLQDASADQAQSILNSLNGQKIGKIEVKFITAAILLSENKSTEADRIITKVIKDNKDDFAVLHNVAWYYLNKKDYNLAMKYCKESIVKNKNYPDNYGFLMPEILKAEGKGDEGEPYFRTALLKEPYNYNIMLTIADYYWYTTKDSTKAMEYFQFAEIIKPNNAEIKYNMALIQITNNYQDAAIALLNECIKLDPTIPKYYRTLGTIYIQRKDYPNAIIQIRNAYHANENDILALNNAGCYYISVESSTNLEKGVFNLQKAFEGLNASYDQYTKDTITANYQKAKKLLTDFQNGSDNQVLTIPDFVYFY